MSRLGPQASPAQRWRRTPGCVALALGVAALAPASATGPAPPQIIAATTPAPTTALPFAAPPQQRPAAAAAAAATVQVDARAAPEAAPPGLAGSAIALRSADPAFGGLSAVEVAPDGASAYLLSDRGALLHARILRRDGALAGLAAVRRLPLTPPATDRGRLDTEGLAMTPDGALVLSLEGPSRLWRLGDGGAAAIPGPRAFDGHQTNSGLEALAVDADGALYAAAERSGALDRPYTLHRRGADGRWSEAALPRRPPLLLTGADIGPDGALYLVERDFALLAGGFSWRLSRVDMDAWPALAPVTLATVAGGLDNVEGVSIWRDDAGRLRALLVADDNFSALQRNTLIEVILPAP